VWGGEWGGVLCGVSGALLTLITVLLHMLQQALVDFLLHRLLGMMGTRGVMCVCVMCVMGVMETGLRVWHQGRGRGHPLWGMSVPVLRSSLGHARVV
jgi:hypothetical protein